MPESESQQIRQARSKFAAMAASYFMGTFNDNFYKAAILVLAVVAGFNDFQGYAIVIFTVPFLLFAAPAGWFADRFSKRRVVIGAKILELLAVLAGALGVCMGHFGLMGAMLFLMGTQATFFSPALNGSIPELYPETYVTKANGLLRMLVTVAILAGTGLAGIVLDRPGSGLWGVELGRLYVSALIIGVSLVGLLVSFGVPFRPAADPTRPFPWSGPVDTLKRLIQTGRDPLLALTIGSDVFIWGVGSLQILLIYPLGLQQFGLSKTMTSLLVASQLVGIGAGGLMAGQMAKGPRWYRVLAPAALSMGCLMLLASMVPALTPSVRVPILFILLGLVGAAGGLFLIPCESFVQVRPSKEQKGAVWAAANFAVFSGILLSGPVANVFNAHLRPTTSFGVAGVISVLMSLLLLLAFRRQK
jgi:MFS family permease